MTDPRTHDIASLRLPHGELTGAPVVLVLRRRHRIALWWAGRRDGRRAVTPDPESGHTTYSQRLAAEVATAERHEQIVHRTRLSRIGEQQARVGARLQESRDRLAELRADPAGDTADLSAVEGDHAATGRAELERIRRVRARQVEGDALVRRIADLTEESVALDELVHHHERAHERRLQRIAENGELVVAVYWRALLARHPEADRMRALYPVPRATCP
ncbi:hypothetical protein [Pseudonocardia alni]|uniref:hypothetical protein n=1 Tax=Pseudonocardia alni TaxID=33907 RepID=UPI0027A681D4|nr:hypothetical protein PaSha_12860 [Pseudonocardia alni]